MGRGRGERIKRTVYMCVYLYQNVYINTGSSSCKVKVVLSGFYLGFKVWGEGKSLLTVWL